MFDRVTWRLKEVEDVYLSRACYSNSGAILVQEWRRRSVLDLQSDVERAADIGRVWVGLSFATKSKEEKQIEKPEPTSLRQNDKCDSDLQRYL